MMLSLSWRSNIKTDLRERYTQQFSILFVKSAKSELRIDGSSVKSLRRECLLRETPRSVGIATFCDARYTVAVLFYASTCIRTILGN